MKKYISKSLLMDPKAPPPKPGQPYFIRSKDEKAYTGFPLISETETDGFVFGAISNLLEPDNEKGCIAGDGFVQAPDGSRAGIVWQIYPNGEKRISTLSEPDEKRWGVYNVGFPKPIKLLEDLIYNFREVLPLIKKEYTDRLNHRTQKINPKRYFCPCCGYKTLEEKPPGTFDICSICFWEDDEIQFDDPNYRGGANNVSLLEARVNFKNFGANTQRNLQYTRKPTDYDTRDINWKGLGYPEDISYDGLCPIIFQGDEKKFNELVDKININEKDSRQINYLQYAIAYKQNNIAKKLIQKNIDINNRDDRYKTALLYAAENMNFEVAKLLLEKGAHVDLSDNWGNTPLWYAAFGNYKARDYNLVELLIKAGADPLHKNKAGTTPIYLAKNVKDEKLLKILTLKSNLKMPQI